MEDIEEDMEDNTAARTPNHTNAYCWTHGCCAHTGRSLQSLDDGHNADAHFKYIKGGNTYLCFCINPQYPWLAGITNILNKSKPNSSYAKASIPPYHPSLDQNKGISYTRASVNYISPFQSNSCKIILPMSHGTSVKPADGNWIKATHYIHMPLNSHPKPNKATY